MEKAIAVVTGGNGFVGSHLVDLLIKKGNTVKCIVRKSSNLKWLKDKPVEIYDSGLFDREALKQSLRNRIGFRSSLFFEKSSSLSSHGRLSRSGKREYGG